MLKKGVKNMNRLVELYWFVASERNSNEDERYIFKEFYQYTESQIKIDAEKLNKDGFIKPLSFSGPKDNLYKLENLSVFPNSEDRFRSEYGESRVY